MSEAAGVLRIGRAADTAKTKVEPSRIRHALTGKEPQLFCLDGAYPGKVTFTGCILDRNPRYQNLASLALD